MEVDNSGEVCVWGVMSNMSLKSPIRVIEHLGSKKQGLKSHDLGLTLEINAVRTLPNPLPKAHLFLPSIKKAIHSFGSGASCAAIRVPLAIGASGKSTCNLHASNNTRSCY
eukprot:1149497-Pelagomonas_calceolata.AAC.7